RPCIDDAAECALGPERELLFDLLAFQHVDAPSPRFDLLIWCASTHPKDDSARHDGVGQIAQTSQGDCAVRWYFLRFHLLADDDTSAGDGAFAVSGIEESSYLLILLGLRTKDRVDLVIQDGGPTFLRSHLSKEVCWRNVDGLYRTRHQWFGHLQDAGLAGGWLLREGSKTWRAFPGVHGMRVSDPQRVCVVRIFGWIGDKAPDECVNLIEKRSAIYWHVRVRMVLYRLGVSPVSPGFALPLGPHPINLFVEITALSELRSKWRVFCHQPNLIIRETMLHEHHHRPKRKRRAITLTFDDFSLNEIVHVARKPGDDLIAVCGSTSVAAARIAVGNPARTGLM